MGIFRRRVVEQDAGLSADFRARLNINDRHYRVGHKPGTVVLGIVRWQQTIVRILEKLSGEGVNGLNQPGRLTGLHVDPGTNAKDKALGFGKIELSLEQRTITGNVHVNITDFHIAEAEFTGL